MTARPSTRVCYYRYIRVLVGPTRDPFGRRCPLLLLDASRIDQDILQFVAPRDDDVVPDMNGNEVGASHGSGLECESNRGIAGAGPVDSDNHRSGRPRCPAPMDDSDGSRVGGRDREGNRSEQNTIG